MRLGIGYDIHRLKRGRKLLLGGVHLRYCLGLSGHSDGDALIHAVVDALLGAAGLGDIGDYFPDTDKRFKGLDSRVFLRTVRELLKKKRLSVIHIDSVVIAEKPKLTLYKKKMAATIAAELGIPASRVNVKAKTQEGLGAVGKGRAIACQAVASLKGK
jgi:2-C-methyl-D-erythritol 2,4-cyclodiphosphate synthase